MGPVEVRLDHDNVNRDAGNEIPGGRNENATGRTGVTPPEHNVHLKPSSITSKNLLLDEFSCIAGRLYGD